MSRLYLGEKINLCMKEKTHFNKIKTVKKKTHTELEEPS